MAHYDVSPEQHSRKNGTSVSGFGHPSCKGGKPAEEIIKKLTDTMPTGPKHRPINSYCATQFPVRKRKLLERYYPGWQIRVCLECRVLNRFTLRYQRLTT